MNTLQKSTGRKKITCDEMLYYLANLTRPTGTPTVAPPSVVYESDPLLLPAPFVRPIGIGVNISVFGWEILLFPLGSAFPLFRRNVPLICNFQQQNHGKIDLFADHEAIVGNQNADNP